jgi:hypothetical protein
MSPPHEHWPDLGKAAYTFVCGDVILS